jgi:hypothetical protein
MSAAGRNEMRQVVDRLLADFLLLIEQRHHGKPVDGAELRQAAQSFLASPRLNQLLAEAHHRLLESAETELIRQKRGDPFQRLLTHPLTELFTDELLSRDILDNYFSFLHLVLGDTRDVLTESCERILDELRTPDVLGFSWDSFYEDPRVKSILWTALARIAESFRRFEIRRDWFIGLMEHRSQAISIGPNAFVQRHSSEEPQIFGVNEFNLMFVALFGPVHKLSQTEELAFQRQFGAAPGKLFGPLLRELEASGAVF